jgi:signal peptidase complex subunit 1
MDFKGQHRAETLATKMIIYTSLLSFLVGWMRQDFTLMLVLFVAGVILTLVVTVPNWPMYNRHPIAWVAGKKNKSRKGSGIGLLGRARLLFS